MLRSILSKSIFLVYGLLIVENILFAVLPRMLGDGIDGLLTGEAKPYVSYVMLFMLALIIGCGRQFLDTRIFTGAWERITSSEIGAIIVRGAPPAKIQTLAGMMNRYIDFLEETVPTCFRGAIHLTVGTVMLISINPWLGVTVILSVVGGAFSVMLTNRIKRVDQHVVVLRDRGNASIISSDANRYKANQRRIAKSIITISDLHAFQWISRDFVGYISEMIAILLLTRNGASVGEIMSTVTYVWTVTMRVKCWTSFLHSVNAMKVADEKRKELC